MLLKEGSSRETIGENITTERHAGKPEKQAIAIAMHEAGKSRSDGMDSVPLGKCYQDDVPPAVMSGDPVISPTSTSQYSGMQEQLRTAPQPVPQEPVDAERKENLEWSGPMSRRQEQLKESAKRQQSEKNNPHKSWWENEGDDIAPMSGMDAFAKLGAGGDAWSDMMGRRDFSGDVNSSMGRLPEEVSFAQIKRMGAGFNYNQGYRSDPYKK